MLKTDEDFREFEAIWSAGQRDEYTNWDEFKCVAEAMGLSEVVGLEEYVAQEVLARCRTFWPGVNGVCSQSGYRHSNGSPFPEPRSVTGVQVE